MKFIGSLSFAFLAGLALAACSSGEETSLAEEVAEVQQTQGSTQSASEPSDESVPSDAIGPVATATFPGLDIAALDLEDGSTTTIAQLVDGSKPVVLYGYAPHCPTCRAHAASEINDFVAAKGDEYEVIAVGTTDDAQQAQDFYDTIGANHKVIWSGDRDIWAWANGGNAFQRMVVFNADLNQKSDTFSFFEISNLP